MLRCLQRSMGQLMAGAWTARGCMAQATWVQSHATLLHPPTLDDIQAANEELNQAFGPLSTPPTPSSTTTTTISQQEHHHQQQHNDIHASYATTSTTAHPAATPAPAAAAAAVPQPRLTHVDDKGHAHMVDVSGKAPTTRTARASCTVRLGPLAFPLVQQNRAAKGDVLATAQLAGIMAAKHTANLIPLCHNILLSKVSVDLTLDAPQDSVHIASSATTVGPTGVEMEALTAAAVAALTVYDMCKAAAKDIQITDLKLDSKTGGKSADYVR